MKVKVCAQSTGSPLSQACPGKSEVRLTDHTDMAIAVDWNVRIKPINQQDSYAI